VDTHALVRAYSLKVIRLVLLRNSRTNTLLNAERNNLKNKKQL